MTVPRHAAAENLHESSSGRPAAAGDPAELLERHRTALTGFCYRMLGSAFEAEDAVQETLVRAWKAFDRYDERRASPKAWLHAIAANVCTDMLRGARRRALAVDLGPACEPGTPLGPPLPWRAFVQPVPDDRVLPSGDPAELAVARETIRLAFVAALQHLPPRQRAVLILRDVLRWTAAEVAGLLGVTVTAVNSALQRARATLKERDPDPGEPFAPLDAAQRALLARYADAFERHDVEGMVALLHEDATMQMPPFGWWLRGRSAIRAALLGADGHCHGSRLVPVAANGSPAFAQYTPREGVLAPWGLLILDVRGGRITGVTTFLDAEALFPLFGPPARPGGR